MEYADQVVPILKSSLPFWEHLKEAEKTSLSGPSWCTMEKEG